MRQNLLKAFRMIEPWIIWFIAALFYMHQYFLRVSMLSLSTSIERHFHASAAMLGNISASFFYSYLIGQLFSGILINRFGVKRCLIFAAAVVSAGCFFIARSDSVGLIIFGRVLLGVGGAFSLVGALTVAHHWFSENQFSWLNGLTFSLGTLGAFLAGSPLASYISTSGWRDAMQLAGVFSVVLIVLDLIFLRDYQQYKTKIKAKKTIKQQLIIFKEILKEPNIWLLCGFAMFLFLPMAAFANLWVFKFLESDYQSASSIVLYFMGSLIFLGYGISALLVGLFLQLFKTSIRYMFYFTLAALVVSILVIYVHSISIIAMAILLFFFGFFIASVVASMTIIRETFSRHKSPIAFSLITLVLNLGGAVSLTLVGWFLEVNWRLHWFFGTPTEYSLNNFQVALFIIPVSIAIALLFLRKIKEPGDHTFD